MGSRNAKSIHSDGCHGLAWNKIQIWFNPGNCFTTLNIYSYQFLTHKLSNNVLNSHPCIKTIQFKRTYISRSITFQHYFQLHKLRFSIIYKIKRPKLWQSSWIQGIFSVNIKRVSLATLRNCLVIRNYNCIIVVTAYRSKFNVYFDAFEFNYCSCSYMRRFNYSNWKLPPNWLYVVVSCNYSIWIK